MMLVQAAHLADLEGFRGFDEHELEVLAVVMDTRFVRPHDHVFRRCDKASACYWVVRGDVTVELESATGRRETLARLTPGELFGEIALVDGRRRTADCLAGAAGAELALLDRDAFERIFAAGNSFAYKLMDIVASRLVRRQRSAAGRLMDVVVQERLRRSATGA